ncbi:MAG: 16S rRNA (cytosine(967)-C(5))-methyltransferase RsmB [Gammaproteobacteria bacterium]|nr:16S rRNA (cytosine(967)-C(5))-methyltransferase RsmB [Gammaproteobacteria bacterium]
MTDVRAAAATILASLINQRGSLSVSLADFSSHPDAPLLQELCFGTCRWFYLLEHLLDELLNKPLKRKDCDLKCLLLVGLYQLKELSIPEHAVINETVKSAIDLKKPWAKDLINAVLRKYQRNFDDFNTRLEKADNTIRYSCPVWLKNEIAAAWPLHAKEILQNNNLRPPLTLRVNLSRKSREDILKLLLAKQIGAKPGTIAKSSIYIETPMPVEQIPGFKEGWVSIQDESSQLVADILQLNPDQTVLDACAAPGGKTNSILESERSPTTMVSLDSSPSRVEKIFDNLSRLKQTANVIAGDARKPSEWWDGDQFDRILIDAPCSATGVIRRHPDIKILRKPKDLLSLRETQADMLRALWPCLKQNGLLLYTTCSILPKENDLQIKEFLESANNAKNEGIPVDWGVECKYGRQLLTGAIDGPDGFFYSLLRKL